MLARTLPTQVESLLAVDPIGPLVIDALALASKQDLNPAVSAPNPCLSDLPDPHSQGSVGLPVRAIPMERAPPMGPTPRLREFGGHGAPSEGGRDGTRPRRNDRDGGGGPQREPCSLPNGDS